MDEELLTGAKITVRQRYYHPSTGDNSSNQESWNTKNSQHAPQQVGDYTYHGTHLVYSFAKTLSWFLLFSVRLAAWSQCINNSPLWEWQSAIFMLHLQEKGLLNLVSFNYCLGYFELFTSIFLNELTCRLKCFCHIGYCHTTLQTLWE